MSTLLRHPYVLIKNTHIKRYVQDRSCCQKFATNFFSQFSVAKEIIKKKLCQKITYKYRKNRKNNKSNENQDLEKKRSQEGPEMSAKIAKVTRIFHAS